MQNALKHNEVTEAHPLVLHVTLEAAMLVVANEVRPRARRSLSTGMGLSNLAERVKLVSDQSMTWGREGDRFVVRIPLKAEGRRLKAASSPHRPAEPDGGQAQPD